MNNYLSFNDKVALVTGASSGMGLATAQAFAEAGASVVLADSKEEAVRKAAEKLVNEGHRALAIHCDVSNDAQVEAMVERTVAEFGRLDAAFNNAGVMATVFLTQRKEFTKGPADWFTGTVRIDPLFQANAPARASGASVTFEPGARTVWHTHPLGQTLIVTSGCGWRNARASQSKKSGPGDVVCFPPGEKHWHGAAPTTAMTHIAIQEALDGKVVDWMEKVSDKQYRK
jgi:NAD(P)-dependent dehydrogenase (short-subunit alcohol dehydrogenase family)